MDLLGNIENAMNKTRGAPTPKRQATRPQSEKMDVDQPLGVNQSAGLKQFKIPKRRPQEEPTPSPGSTIPKQNRTTVDVSVNPGRDQSGPPPAKRDGYNHTSSRDQRELQKDPPFTRGFGYDSSFRGQSHDGGPSGSFANRSNQGGYNVSHYGKTEHTEMKPGADPNSSNSSGIKIANTVDVQMNDFKINLNDAVQEVYKYQVDITVIKTSKGGEVKEVDATVCPKNAVAIDEKRRALKNVISIFLKKHTIDEFDAAYDGGSSLYLKRSLLEECMTNIYEKDELSMRAQFYLGDKRLTSVRLTVTLAKVFPLRNSLNSTEDSNFRDVCAFIDVLTDTSLNRKSDFIVIKDMNFHKGSDNAIDVGPGLVVKTGFKKSARIVKNDGQVGMVLTLTVSRKPFFKDQTLLDFLKEKFKCWDEHTLERELKSRRKEASRAVRHLIVTTAYTEVPNNVVLFGVSSESSNDLIIPDLDKSIAQYHQDKFESLSYPYLPVVSVKKGKSYNYYPIEKMKMSRCQTINVDKLGTEQPKVVNATRLSPHQVASLLLEQMDKSNLAGENRHLKAFGIKISSRPNTMRSSVIQMPAIKTGTKTHNPANFHAPNDMNWRNTWSERYLIPAEVPKAVVINFNNSTRAENTLRDVIQQLAREGSLHGMKFDYKKFDFEHWNSMSKEDFLCDVKRLVDKGNKFIILVSATKNDEEVHNNLKDAEQKFGITTQHLCVNTITGNKGMGKQTINGILMKMNQKLGGVNYHITLTNEITFKRDADFQNEKYFSKHRMYVGLDISHPGALSVWDQQTNASVLVPSTVGFSYTTTHPTAMRGRYWWQAPREQLIISLREHMVQALKQFKEETKSFPKEVVVFRGGVSDGEFAQVREYEGKGSNGIEQAFRDLSIMPALYLISVQRNPNNKMLRANIPSAKSSGKPRCVDMNVPAGTCVIDGVMNPDFIDVLMVSQQGQIGTSRCTRYTICYQQAKIKMDANTLGFTGNAMCYAHGVSTCPTGLPAPLQAATNLSKRGQAIFKNNYGDQGDSMSTVSGSSEREADEQSAKEFYERQAEQLTVTLNKTQFWA